MCIRGRRHAQRERDTHRGRETHTERQRHAQGERDTHRERETHTERERHTQRERDTQRERETHTERERHREREREHRENASYKQVTPTAKTNTEHNTVPSAVQQQKGRTTI